MEVTMSESQTNHGPLSHDTSAHDEPEREAIRKRLEARRDFSSHVVAYVVVNAFLIAVWAMTGAGYFWPAWVLCGWAIGLVLHGWEVFVRRPVNEADIDAELRKQSHLTS
jgi:fatty acid desaturase